MTPAEQTREAAAKLASQLGRDDTTNFGSNIDTVATGDAIADAIRALPLPPEPEPPIVAELEAALLIAGPIALTDLTNHPFVLNEKERQDVETISSALASLAAYREGRKG